MADKYSLKVNISADLAEFRRAINGMRSDLNGIGATSQRAGRTGASGFSVIGGSISGARAQVAGLIAAFVSLRGVMKGIDIADQMKSAKSRIEILTKSTYELARAQGKLFEMAQNTRASYGETIELYAKIANATAGLGAQQDTQLRVTELVNKAIAAVPVSAAAATGAIIQFGQALSNNFTAGAQEINSINEQAPGLAKALADGLSALDGVKYLPADLKRLGEEGKLSTERVVNGMLAIGKTIDEEFARKPVLVSQAFTQVENSVAKIIGEIDDATGATAALSNKLTEISRDIGSSGIQEKVIAFAAEWRSAFGQIALEMGILGKILSETLPEYFAVLDDAAGGVFSSLAKGAGNTVDDIIAGFKSLPATIHAFIKILIVEVGADFDRLVSLAKRTGRYIKAALLINYDAEDAQGESDAEARAIQQARLKDIEAILEEAAAHKKAGEAARERYRKEKKAKEDAAAAALNASGIDTGDKDPRKAGAVNQFDVAKSKIAAEIAALDRLYKAHEISAADYFAKHRDLELAALDAEIAGKRAELGALQADRTKDKEGEQRSGLLTDIQALEAKRVEINAAANDAILAAEKELQDQLRDVRVALLAAEGKDVEARKLELEAQYEDLIKRLQAKGDVAGSALIDRLINAEVAKARLDEINDAVDKALSRLDRAEQSAEAGVATGDISGAEARAGIQSARTAAIAGMQQYREELRLLAEQDAPGAAEALADLEAQIAELAGKNVTGAEAALRRLRTELAELDEDFAGNAIEAGDNAVSNFLYDLATNAATAGEAIRNLARQFAQSLAQMAADALAKKAILSLTGLFGGGTTVPVSHAGGMVGFSGMRRTVPAFLFAGAPRYHSGGIVGLKPGEVPSILQRGEEVLSRNDPRNAANGGGAAPQGGGVRIVNVIDPAMAGDYLNSAAGERTILNLLQRNSGAVKQVLK